MLTVPGVGAITVAGFLAEAGDLNNYDHGQQIIRLAGLNHKEKVPVSARQDRYQQARAIAPVGAIVSRCDADGSEKRSFQVLSQALHDAKSESTEEKTVYHRLMWQTHSSPAQTGDKVKGI